MTNFLIYCLRCPITNEIRYIGQTKRGFRRSYEHRSRTKHKQKNHLSYWLNSLIEKGLKPIFEILETLDKVEKLNEREIYWITYYKNKFNLCNLESGGIKNKIVSDNHNSKFTKGKKLEDYYGVKKAKKIKEKISNAQKGENGSNYGGKCKLIPGYIEKQITSNSKKHIKLIDTFDENKEYYFINSKEAANFLNCSSSTIRELKRNNWKIKRRYIVMDVA